MMKNKHRGRYNNDYSPQYSDPYDIYEKAKKHIKQLKENEKAANKEKKTFKNIF
ncbi:MAG: hypothetical protein ACI4EF_09370 [Coprococcus sp.]